MQMPLTQAIAMGILQGLAEFAPISSSAHLILVPWLIHPLVSAKGWVEDPGQSFDAALHLGTALALILYFRSEWVSLVEAWWGSLSGAQTWENPKARLAWLIIIATIPGAIFGKLMEKRLSALFDPGTHSWAPAAIGGVLAAAGLVLWAADRTGRKDRSMERVSRLDALIIGLSQAMALFPGVSRSGATITAGLSLGLNREAATRFSFLMATPITLGAGLLKLIELRHSTEAHPQASALIAGVLTSAVVGYIVIRWVLGYVQRQNMNLFVVYRVIAGAFIIAIWFARTHAGG